jgi:hypothetical protein
MFLATELCSITTATYYYISNKKYIKNKNMIIIENIDREIK